MTKQFLARPDGHQMTYHQLAPTSANLPGVIFLGGFKSDMTGSKALTLERWCQQNKFAFVRFDYLGHGASSGRFEQGTIGRWYEDAIAVMDEVCIGSQILVGSSMGAWISLLLALARPDRVTGIITLAAAVDFTENLMWDSLSPQEQAKLQQDGIWHQPSEYDDPYPITYRLIEEARQHLLLHQNIPIHCPVRMLHGIQDVDVPWQTSLKTAERLSNSDVQLTLIKDGEHRLSRDQDLALLLRTLAEMLGLRDFIQ